MEWIDDVHLALDSLTHPADRRILVRAHIHDAVVAFILHRTRRVEFVNGLICLLEVVARTGFIAQRPYHDAWRIDMSADSLHDTCHMGIPEFRHMAQRSRTIVILVALDVGLVFEIDTILVACVEPVWVV